MDAALAWSRYCPNICLKRQKIHKKKSVKISGVQPRFEPGTSYMYCNIKMVRTPQSCSVKMVKNRNTKRRKG
jgi:uncharacterized protein affecting Mg2+/Co2+ transport